MTLRFEFIRETLKARLYRSKDGIDEWIPKSVIRSTTKFNRVEDLMNQPAGAHIPEIHELVIEEWWLRSRGYLDDDQDEFDWYP